VTSKASDTKLSRRERNKAATRAAIAQAALDLVAEVGYENITIEMVAARADISRRTFFNYFSSLDEALNIQVTRALDRAIEALDDHAFTMPIVDATIHALHSIADQDFLSSVALLYSQGCTNPSLHANRLIAWEEAITEMTRKLGQRLPNADPFAISVFSHSVLGACNAAFQHWFDTVDDLPTEADTARLKDTLTQAIEIIKDGFPTIASINPTPTPAQKDA
jgi:AcrR family transcriptional regulator